MRIVLLHREARPHDGRFVQFGLLIRFSYRGRARWVFIGLVEQVLETAAPTVEPLADCPEAPTKVSTETPALRRRGAPNAVPAKRRRPSDGDTSDPVIVRRRKRDEQEL